MGILSTFNRVFREVCGASFVDRDLPFWNWSFAECPAGQRIWVAATPDGTIAAHYACVPHRVHTPFGDRYFLHTVDSMVHPDFRSGLKRPGLFVRTTFAFQAACRERGDALTYGYPVRSAERIGKRYLRYETVAVVDYLVRPIMPRQVGRPSGIQVETVNTFASLDVLFEKFARDKTCLTVRNREFIRWRYERTPGDPYVRFEARRDDELVGVAVVRPEHELVPGACTIAEWIVPTDAVDVREALLASANELARQRGRRLLMAAFAPSSREFTAFQRDGFVVEPSANTLERRLTVVHFGDELSSDWLAENWWYSLGDSDLV